MPLIDAEPNNKIVFKPESKFKKPLLFIFSGLTILLLVVAVLSAALYFQLYLPSLKVLASARVLETTTRSSQEVVKSQDLTLIKNHLDKIGTELSQVESDFSKLSWLDSFPVAKNYYQDGLHGLSVARILLETGYLGLESIAPYADLIGLKGDFKHTPGAEKAEDRITLIINTLDLLKPKLGEISTKLQAAKSEVTKIDPNRYPQSFQGIAIRSQLAQGISLLDQAANFVSEAQPLLESVPVMIGKTKPVKYLVLFQNDAELRPTGGFITGYAVITVSKGKITVDQSSDIYKLDERFTKKIPAPEPIKKYHPKVPYWYLRDQNLSPDFKASMDVFFPNYQLTKSPQVQGIIAMDTQLLVKLLKVTGPIGIPGYGNFSAELDNRCNCPNAFYQLQVLAGAEGSVTWDAQGKIVSAPANYDDRKKFLGPVMYSILANVLGQPRSKFPLLFQTAISAIESKNVQMYFTDPTIQSAIEGLNLAGRVIEPTDGDYLMVVDTNFSGGKANIWVKYAADQKIEISQDGTVTKTLTLTYSNPEDSTVKIETGRKLNGLFRDWLRVYVPKGSTLIESTGFETGEATSEDLGKTVFEGFFTLAPANTRVIKIKYTLPQKASANTYKMLIQKQAGAKEFIYNTTINNKKQPEVFLSKDTQLSLSF